MAKKPKPPSLISGTLPKLEDTGKPLADVSANLQTLKGQYHPGTLPLFQQVMGGIAERVYKQRQTSEMGTIGKYMDPTQVSGGQFSSILGWLEGNRGKDISSMYGATMQGFMKSQELISGEIRFLTQMRYDMQNDLQKFKVDLAKNFPGVYNDLGSKELQDLEDGVIPDSLYAKMDNWQRDVYERELRWEEEDRAMERAMYEMDMEYKRAQTSKIKADVAEKKETANNFLDDLRAAKETLAKNRQPEWRVDMGTTTEFTPAQPYNSYEEYQEVVTTLRATYGDKVDEDTLLAAEDSLMLSLSPEDRKSLTQSAGTATAETKMEMEQESKSDEARKTVEFYMEQYGDINKVRELSMDEDSPIDANDVKRYTEALISLY